MISQEPFRQLDALRAASNRCTLQLYASRLLRRREHVALLTELHTGEGGQPDVLVPRGMLRVPSFKPGVELHDSDGALTDKAFKLFGLLRKQLKSTGRVAWVEEIRGGIGVAFAKRGQPCSEDRAILLLAQGDPRDVFAPPLPGYGWTIPKSEESYLRCVQKLDPFLDMLIAEPGRRLEFFAGDDILVSVACSRIEDEVAIRDAYRVTAFNRGGPSQKVACLSNRDDLKFELDRTLKVYSQGIYRDASRRIVELVAID